MSDAPSHVAIIMDGNSRWAKKNKLTKKEGHRAGVKAAKNIIEYAAKKHLDHLTLFAFSTENWGRSKFEVNSIMDLFVEALREETPELIKNSVKVNFIGDVSKLNKIIIKKIIETKGLTSNYQPKLNLNIAISYGGKWDIVNAVKKIHEEILERKIKINQLDEKLFSLYLDTSKIPDPDLIIRTGNEKRLSNFLIWQAAYSELIFSKKLWPDFSNDDLRRALNQFKERKRNFGKRK